MNTSDARAEISLMAWTDMIETARQLLREGKMEPQLIETDPPRHLKLLDNGGVVAVIGARESNIPEYWNHPRCVFMEGRFAAQRGLPKNARAVIFTRFLGHTDFRTVMGEARDRDITIFPVQGTGALKRTLSALLDPPPVVADPIPPVETSTVHEVVMTQVAEKPETSESVESTPALPKGATLKWVRTQYVPGMKFAELLAVAKSTGQPFRESGLSAAFYAIKREQREAAPPVLALVPPAVAATPAPAPAPRIEPPAESDYLLKLIDDSIASLQLVREVAVKVAEDRAKLQHIAKMLQSL